MILVHGRGATAEGILDLARELQRPSLAYLAPQAAGYTWYPHGFMEPLDRNQPGLDSGLSVLGGLIEGLAADGIPRERIILLGFSQGACLSLEFAARHATRYGAIVGLSGGLIGQPGTPRDYDGSLEGTPVFLGCSDRDPHVPLERVDESERVLDGLGADVTRRIYPGMGHTVNADELEHVRRLVDEVYGGGATATARH